MDTRRHAPTSLAWSDSGLCPVIATETGRGQGAMKAKVVVGVGRVSV